MTTASTPLELADILDKAAAKLDQRGLVKGQNWENGRVCATGAIRIAIGGSANGRGFSAAQEELALKVLQAVDKFIHARTYGRFRYLTAWNDDTFTTQAQVVAALKGAAADLRDQAPTEPEPTDSGPESDSPIGE